MAPKRKTSGEKDPRSKTKVAKKSTSKGEFLALSEVETLGNQILDSASYNNLVTLISQFELVVEKLKQVEDRKAETLGRKLSLTLFKSFQKLFKEGLLVNRRTFDEKKELVVKWSIDKYDGFKRVLFNVISSKFSFKSSLQLDALEITLNLVKLESQYMGPSKEGFFANVTYSRLIRAVLEGENGDVLADDTNDDFILLEFIDKFKSHWDLQTYAVHNLNDTLSEWKDNKSNDELRIIFSKYFTIMKNQLLFSENELESQPTWISTKLPSTAFKPVHFKTQFQKSFITILSYPLNTSQYKNTLLVLHKRFIPYMVQPQSLMDFLTDCYDITDDSIIPILALNSLYELMRKFNLEYPDFYTKLYSLLKPDLLYTKYRSRFFRLCDLFLSSSHLSANLVASFIKKLARLSIASTASGVVIIIPFIYNLLKKHPSCMIMLHNTNVSDEYTDPFDVSETNPLLTKAMGSSLWELETLMTHYHPNIATLAKVFGEPFRKHNYNMEDFLDWSYVSLLESEKNRRYKTVAALEFEEFESVFENDSNKENSSVYASGWSL